MNTQKDPMNRFPSDMTAADYDKLPATEVVSQRTECGAVFTVGGGRYQAVTFAEPIHHYNEMTKQWESIDRTMQPTRDQKAAEADASNVAPDAVLYTAQAENAEVELSRAGSRPFMTLGDHAHHTVSVVLEHAADVLPMDENDLETVQDSAEGMSLAQLRERIMDKLQGRAVYKDILPGIDLEVLTGQTTMICASFEDAEAVKPVTLTFQGDTALLQAMIAADPDKESPLATQQPILQDAYGETGSVNLVTEREDDTVHLTLYPDEAFTAQAVYPLTLLLSFGTEAQSSSIESTYVSQQSPTANYASSTSIMVSGSHSINAGNNERISYLRVTSLPVVHSRDFITGAYLVVANSSAPASERPAMAAEVTSTTYWTPTQINYNNRPAVSDLFQDYALYQANKYAYHELDLTDLAYKWYHGSLNNGVALVPPSIYGTQLYLHSVNSTTTNRRPYFKLNYASLAGLESYFTYDQQSAGRAGVGSVGLHNGNLTFSHSDTIMNGLRLPVSVTHYYNACNAQANDCFMGYGWRTSLHQTLHKELQNSKVVYVYTDGDGTEHWFEPVGSSTTQYKDTSGLDLTLAVGSNVTITDKGNNVMTFPLISATPTASAPTGKVMITQLADANGNTVTITSSGMKITKVTDGAGRVTNFAYGADGNCSCIYTPWQTTSTGARFTYTSPNQLTTITYEDSKTSTFSYTAKAMNGQTHYLLTSAKGPENVTITYTYTNTGASVNQGLPFCVATAKVANGSLVQSNVSYAYGCNVTSVTDLLTSKKLRYHFNFNGNTTSVDDELGYAVHTAYDQTGANANAPINHPTLRSRMQRVVTNLLIDGSIERDNSAWVTANEVGTGTFKREQSVYQFGLVSRKITINAGGRSVCKQTVTATPGKDYTLSCYIRSHGPQAYVRASYTLNGATVDVKSDPVRPVGDGKFHRVAVSFTLPAGAAASLVCAMVAETDAGYAYFDCMQLEEGLTCNPYNMVENSNFALGSGTVPDVWTKDSTVSSSYIAIQSLAACGAPSFLTGRSVQLQGRFDRTIEIYQTIRAYGKAGDRFTVGGWCKSFTKANDEAGSIYCRLKIYFGNSTYAGSVFWNHEEGEWQFSSTGIVAAADYSQIKLVIQMNRQMNYANFAGLYIYPEQFGTDYVYDANGNCKEAILLFGKGEKTTYDANNNPTSYTAPGRTVSTTYDYGTTDAQQKKHLLLKSISPLGTVMSYVYNSYGLPTQAQTANSNASLFMRSTTGYTSTGNYVSTQTDARGKTTTTATDANKGTVTSITDPKGETVSYAYDTLRRMTQASAPLNGVSVKNQYAYDGTTGVMTQVKHNTASDTCDVVYNFGYDALLRPTTVKVGTQTLSTNAYTNSGIHTGTLNTVTYGNGFVVKNIYDAFNRITSVQYNNTTRFSYAYNAASKVAWVKDHLLNRIRETEYDMAGRPCRSKQHNGSTHLYTSTLGYDATTGLLSEFGEYVGTGYTAYSTTFGYDNENRPTTLNYGSANRQTTVTYDALGRISQKTVKPGGTAFTTNYSFVAGGHGTGSTSPLVQTISQPTGNLTYTYDNNGNILSVNNAGVTTTYTYDMLGQLTRVNDPKDTTSGSTGTTWVYTYDHGGNILSKQRYAYTTGTLGSVLQTIAYAYEDGNWKDKLTKYNGVSITCDAIGNPLSDGTWTYSWTNGRQLNTMNKTGMNTSYVYNEEGLRVQKTCNNVVTSYVLHGKNVVHLTHGSNNLHFFYGADGTPAIVEYNGVSYGYVKNLQGDIIAIIDGNCNVVVTYTYDAWGKMLSRTGSMAGTLGTLNPFRYRGYIYDEETGLYYLQSRYYNPTWCRFVSADIFIGIMGQLLSHNIYAYCKNNCVTRIDAGGFEDIYVFYYHRPESKASLITQAQTAIYYDSNANNVHMIEVGYSDDLVSAWNAMDDNDLSEVYFVLHGSAGRIVFDEPNGEYISFVGDGGNVSFDAFQPKKINGALYMLNCHGADSRKGQSVAEYFANLCSTNVFACVCGVSYTKMPFSKRTYAREEKKEFFNLFSFNWKWFCFEDGTLNVFTLFSKWLN